MTPDTPDHGSRDINRRTLLQYGTPVAAIFVGAGCLGDDDDDPTIDIDDDTDDADDVTAEPGGPVELNFVLYSRDDDPERHEYGLLAADYLEDLGVVVDRNITPGAIRHDRTTNRNFDAINARPGVAVADPGFYIRAYYHSETAPAGAGNNFAQYQNPDLDELWEAGEVEADPDARRDIIFEAEELVNEDEPVTGTHAEDMNTAILNTVVDVDTTRPVPEHSIQDFENYCFMELLEGDQLFRGSHDDHGFINPFQTSGRVNRDQRRIMSDTLKYIPSGESEIDNWAATRGEWTDDTTYEITLRDDYYFHNDEQVTAEELEFTFEYYHDHHGPLGGFMDSIDSYDVETDLDLTLNFSDHIPAFEMGLTAIEIIPSSIWQDVPDEVDADTVPTWQNPEPITSGPWMFDSWDFGERFITVRNPDHFYPPQFEEHHLIQYADPGGTLLAIENEEIHVTHQVPHSEAARISEEVDHVDIVSAPMETPNILPWNTQNAPTGTRELRQAYAYAINKREIIDAAYYGHGNPIPIPVMPHDDSWWSPDLNWYSEDQSDIDSARDLLEDAGYTWDDDGVLRYPS